MRREVGTAPGADADPPAHGVRVLRAYLSLGVLNLLQYRSDFAISLLNAVIGLVTQVLALSVVFSATADLRGWGPYDLLVLVGIHFFLSGLIGVVMRPSMEALMEGIRLGTFDFLLIKPADSQLLASTQEVRPQAATDVLVGIAVIVFGDDPAGGQPRAAGARAVPGHAAGRLVIVYSFLLLLATCAFWFVKLENVLVIFQALFGNAGRWPVTIFPPWLRRSSPSSCQSLRGHRPGAGADQPAGLSSAVLAVAMAIRFFAASRCSGWSRFAATPAHPPDRPLDLTFAPLPRSSASLLPQRRGACRKRRQAARRGGCEVAPQTFRSH